MIDTHTHLDFPQFDRDRDEVIKNAFESGVERIVNIGTDLESSRKSVELAQRFEKIYATVGFHPHDASKLDENSLKELEKLALSPKVVAIGEIGLDFYRNLSPKKIQIEAFRKQVALAKKLKLPVVVHIREAYEEEVFEILKEAITLKIGVLLHCFSGDIAQAKQAIKMGFLLSFNGVLTYPNSKSLEVAKSVPLDFILTETDCPYLTPVPHRGERNQPSHVKFVLEKLAELFKPLTFEDIERITTHNANKFFKLNYVEPSQITYPIRNSLYLNITNRCSNACSFCVRNSTDFVKGHNLRLPQEPTYEEIISALKDLDKYQEVVFCGYGEPTERLEIVKQVASFLKAKKKKVRLDTNGEGNLINQKNILPELSGLIDVVSVSLNVDSSEKFDKYCLSQFGPGTFFKVIEFITKSRKLIPETMITFLDLPEVDLGKCEKIARDLDVKIKIRHYDVVG
jgi:TatD DNase family protein